MRTSLRHPQSDDRRRLRRGRERQRSRRLDADATAEPERADARVAAPAADAAAQRVRAAGGPLDRASYSCQCGYVFAAAVTTTVECPHCGDAQAW